MVEHLASIGFEVSKADQCLFVPSGNWAKGERLAILLWVDDFIFLHEQESTYLNFLSGFKKKFNVPVAGPLTTFLGMEFIILDNYVACLRKTLWKFCWKGRKCQIVMELPSPVHLAQLSLKWIVHLILITTHEQKTIVA